MKKLIICITLIACSHLASAQQKYFPFSIADKHGITDVSGNEFVKPAYGNSEIIEAKSQIYLTGLKGKPSVIVDAKTGAKQFFEYILSNQAKIKDVPYSLVLNKGKRFLLSEESSKTINLTEEYWDFNNVGNYIIAEYYPKTAPSKSSYDKNGIPLPPKIEPVPDKTSTILANDETLKRLIKGSFDSYIVMYKELEKEKEDGLVHVQLIKLEDYNKPKPFDFILLTKGNTHSLYNDKLILVKTFVLAKATEEQLLNASKKIVKLNLVSSFNGNYPAPKMVMASPSMPRAVSTKSPEEKKEDKKPFKPFFYTEKLENGKTLFALQESEEISNHILELEAGVKLRLNEKEHTLTIVPEEKENSEFSFDPKTGAIYLPKAYLKQLGITII